MAPAMFFKLKQKIPQAGLLITNKWPTTPITNVLQKVKEVCFSVWFFVIALWIDLHQSLPYSLWKSSWNSIDAKGSWLLGLISAIRWTNKCQCFILKREMIHFSCFVFFIKCCIFFPYGNKSFMCLHFRHIYPLCPVPSPFWKWLLWLKMALLILYMTQNIVMQTLPWI